MTFPHIVLAVALTCLWGFTFVIMRDLVDHVPPLLLAALRVVAAATPVLFLLRTPRVSWGWVFALGATQGVIQMSLLFFGLKFGMPAGLASLVVQSQVLFTAVLAFMVLGERPKSQHYLGILVSGGGMVLIATTLPGGPTLVGLLLILLAALTWSASNILVKRAGTDDVLGMVAWAHVIGITPLFALSYLVEGEGAFAVIPDLSIRIWGEIAFVGLVSTCFGFMVWSFLMRRYTANAVAPYSLIIPIAGMISAALLLGETFGPLRIVGAALVLVGLAFGTVRLRRRTPHVTPH